MLILQSFGLHTPFNLDICIHTNLKIDIFQQCLKFNVFKINYQKSNTLKGPNEVIVQIKDKKTQESSAMKCPQVLNKIILELVMNSSVLDPSMHCEDSLDHVCIVFWLDGIPTGDV